jgi:hypothetical protein
LLFEPSFICSSATGSDAKFASGGGQSGPMIYQGAKQVLANENERHILFFGLHDFLKLYDVVS